MGQILLIINKNQKLLNSEKKIMSFNAEINVEHTELYSCPLRFVAAGQSISVVEPHFAQLS
jgi:hypothetical protein